MEYQIDFVARLVGIGFVAYVVVGLIIYSLLNPLEDGKDDTVPPKKGRSD